MFLAMYTFNDVLLCHYALHIAAKVKNCPGVRLEIHYIYVCTVSKYGNMFCSITLLATFILQSLPQILAAH